VKQIIAHRIGANKSFPRVCASYPNPLAAHHLEGANLRMAHLEGARPVGVHLEGADLSFAHLEDKKMAPSDLERLRKLRGFSRRYWCRLTYETPSWIAVQS
jgi:hypothetical protein